jgi:hypothetical protein
MTADATMDAPPADDKRGRCVFVGNLCVFLSSFLFHLSGVAKSWRSVQPFDTPCHADTPPLPTTGPWTSLKMG